MKKIIVFAGTSEGRKIAEYLQEKKIPAHICVATAYGEQLLPESEHLQVSAERLQETEMEQLLQQKTGAFVIDATHPYATEVSKNIRTACANTGMEYIRLLRMDDIACEQNNEQTVQLYGKVVEVQSVTEAVSFLEQTKGNVLVTTGSKEMAAYQHLTDAKERLYYRVLSTSSIIEQCQKFGVCGRHLFAMQGPFSEEMNYAMLVETEASYLVTKESGHAGGFTEKLQAAKRAGVTVIAIKRPEEKNGYSFDEVIERIESYVAQEKETTCKVSDTKKQVFLVGTGMGQLQNLTLEAVDKIQQADLIMGAGRMLEAVQTLVREGVPQVVNYQPEAIISTLEEYPQAVSIVVLYSGDIGFYSGARQLQEKLQALPSCNCSLVCGISSPVYLLSRLGIAWEDVKMMSLHGRSENIIAAVQQHEKVFTLLGGNMAVATICEQLLENQCGHVQVTVGENLSYPGERIRTGIPTEFIGIENEGLAAVYLENPKAMSYQVTAGIPDEQFIRDKVPMTKQEVRSISLSKLQLHRGAVIYDIGAGTGSMSVELARLVPEGQVYAIEKEEAARKLIVENQKQFGVANLTVIAGKAGEEPDCMEALPLPTHAFIGGSSGAIEPILKQLLEKNSEIRIVLNVIALETLSQVVSVVKELGFLQVEYVQVSIARSRKLGAYQLMQGQNPVYIITLCGKAEALEDMQ